MTTLGRDERPFYMTAAEASLLRRGGREPDLTQRLKAFEAQGDVTWRELRCAFCGECGCPIDAVPVLVAEAVRLRAILRLDDSDGVPLDDFYDRLGDFLEANGFDDGTPEDWAQEARMAALEERNV